MKNQKLSDISVSLNLKQQHFGVARQTILPIVVIAVIFLMGTIFLLAANSVAPGTTTTTTVSSTSFSSSLNSSTQRLPVIIIPGVAGSGLQIGMRGCRTYPCPLWPFPDNASILQRLGLQSNGITPSISGRNVTVSGALRNWPVNFYGTLIQNLTQMGYVQNRNLFVFAYDWRLDLASQLPLLDSVVNNALTQNNASKVILIAHSMGGLVAEGYVLSSNTRAQKVDSIISMSTPYWRAPLAYYTAVNGYTFGNPSVNPLQMKLLGQNMTSLYELLPRSPFITNRTSGQMLSLSSSYSVVYKAVLGNPNVGLLGNFSLSRNNTWTMNQGLLSAAMNFWQLSGTPNAPAAMPVKLYAIIGDGFQTLSGYNMSLASGTQPYIQLANGAHVVTTPVFSDGDGTVPLASAQISTATRTYYIANVPATGYFGSGAVSSAHSDLPTNPSVLRIVDQKVSGSPPASIPYRAPSSLVGNSTNLVLHSNAILSIRDVYSSGHLGPNQYGGVDENLSGGTYLNIDGVEYASLVPNTNDAYIVSVNGTSSGEFSLYVNFTMNGAFHSFSYPGVSVQNGTVGVVEINATNIASTGILPALSMTEANGTTVSIAAQNDTIPTNPSLISGNLLVVIAVIAAIVALGGGVLFSRRMRKFKNS